MSIFFADFGRYVGVTRRLFDIVDLRKRNVGGGVLAKNGSKEPSFDPTTDVSYYRTTYKIIHFVYNEVLVL